MGSFMVGTVSYYSIQLLDVTFKSNFSIFMENYLNVVHFVELSGRNFFCTVSSSSTSGFCSIPSSPSIHLHFVLSEESNLFLCCYKNIYMALMVTKGLLITVALLHQFSYCPEFSFI